MSSASHPDLSFPEVSDPIPIGQVIGSIIPSLLDYISGLKQSLPPRKDDNAQVNQKAGDFRRTRSLPDVDRGDKSRKDKNENKGPTRSSSDGKEATDNSLHEDLNVQLSDQIERLHRDLGYVKDELEKHRKIEDRVGELIKDLIRRSKTADSTQTPGAAHGDSEKIQVQLSAVAEMVTKLKLHIPPSHKILSSTSSDAHRGAQAANEFGDYREMPDLAVERKFLGSSVYKNLRSTYDLLDTRSKLCLLCFAVFPEHAKIKKRAMYYWWIGEGLIDPSNREDKSVGDILKEFVDMGFIQPVIKKRRIVTNSKSYTMLPLIRSMVVILAKEAMFFDFDSRGCPTVDFSKCLRSCLVRSKEASWQNMMAETQVSDLEKLHTLFNVNESYLNFKVEWFSNMKNINSLSLGSWRGSKKDHIEVENTEFLRGLKYMKHLKLLSLQGISRITELPNSIGKLYNLRILDLRACHNLESLPDEICSLKELVGLDVSGCYLLEYMPKGLGSLVKLEVLMGFVVSDLKGGSYCTVQDLAKLSKLRKLGFRTSRKTFPSKGELTTLQQLSELRKLTIEWGEISEKDEGTESAGDDRSKIKCISGLFPFKKCATQKPIADEPKLFEKLEKLDLLCYPSTTPPDWLLPEKLENLESLYVRGGRLHHLGQVQGDKKWKVTTMRLKYLNELTMDWREMQRSFPELVCLQTVDCPKLTLFPCNKNGVWLKEQFSESNRKRLTPQA
ncbi:disease resistance RPP13-like protein 4 [Rhodamnia argentea]|uniref:Disease resistance RPP13-like protein 4 n=1 Tax=Rhodamnia argentea TaxID=178133 RepID=A0A8B8NR65_9MYRT|nr:disease resistance RPP13-like protein 4 [Rhodamnia argentea]XP_048141356.1 disease resistance RPP13-like protein 4 [Rhodamnia argentea]